MKASPSDQRSILDIARFDQQTNSLRHKAANLPELADLASTTIKSNNARDLRIAAETELSDVKRELLRAEGDVEQIVSRITRDEARHAAVIADLEIRKENALTILHKDLDAIAKDRTETVNGVAKELVDLYEKIRETTGGAGAAALSAGSCTGCNLSVNAVELKRMSDLADDEVVRCEECRCILVRGI
jgi:predicted  nucleic acid-binding Zn-ribbon protein